MARVTYILGAGASAGSLPTVDRFNDEIEAIIKKLRTYKNQLKNIAELPDDIELINQHLTNIIADLWVIQAGCINHRSIDTYAKKLFLTQITDKHKMEYRRVKCSIILFFELYRYFNDNKADKRYDSFLATILKRDDPKLPSDINILSWNYDYEFERAYMKYAPDKKNLHQVYDDMNIVHKNNKKAKSLANNFGIIKINGTIGFIKKDGDLLLGLGYSDLYMTIFTDENDVSEIYPLLKSYIEYTYLKPNEYEPAISFAWEDDYGIIKVKDEIKWHFKIQK